MPTGTQTHTRGGLLRDKAPFCEPISRQVLPSCRPGDMRVLCCALSLPSTPTRDTPANAVLSAVERRDNVAATRKWRSAVELVAHPSARAQQRSWVPSMSTIIISSSRSCLMRFLIFPHCHERRLGGGTSHGVGRSSTVATATRVA